MISKQRKQDIISAFQRSLKRDNSAEIEKFTLEELQDADTMLGPRDLNSPYRIAIKNRIAELAATAVSQSKSSTTSMEEHNTRVDRFIARVKNHPILSGILIIGIVYSAALRQSLRSCRYSNLFASVATFVSDCNPSSNASRWPSISVACWTTSVWLP